MPGNPSNPPDNDKTRGIISELDVLRRELLGHQRPGPDTGKARSDLIIFRFVYGFSWEKWTELVSRPGLAGWLAMPLQDDSHFALRRMQQALDSLAHAAGHDDLTGLARRDVFEQALVAEMERARRTRQSVSLAILDIDDFKKINDTYGHIHGDAVLQAFSAALRDGVRETDLCARYGGEEFALLMPATPMVKAVQLLERLMAAARALETSITCSVGLACFKGLGELTPTGFLEMADKALYEAKNSGKDRIVKAPFKDIAPPLAEQTLVDSNEKSFLFSTQSST